MACLEPPIFPSLAYVDDDEDLALGTFANYTATHDPEDVPILYDVS